MLPPRPIELLWCAGQIVFNYLAIDTGGDTINGVPVSFLLMRVSKCKRHAAKC